MSSHASLPHTPPAPSYPQVQAGVGVGCCNCQWGEWSWVFWEEGCLSCRNGWQQQLAVEPRGEGGPLRSTAGQQQDGEGLT